MSINDVAAYPVETEWDSHARKKSDHVKKVFENSEHYLKSRRVDIRFRIDTVKRYASGVKWQKLLDIGCGDGSVSLQLLNKENQITLMDLSTSMVERVRRNTPPRLADNVIVRNENFATAGFEVQSFDLIMAVGVLAHVDSPEAFLEKIKSLLAPSGHLILEFTDAFHVVGRIGRFWGQMKEVVAPAKYPTNKLSYAAVSDLLERNDFEVASVFRYSRFPLPGFNRVISHDLEYSILTSFFGEAGRSKKQWLGNEYIFLLKSK